MKRRPYVELPLPRVFRRQRNFFLVDRRGQMSAGLVFRPARRTISPPAPSEFQRHLDELFPTGVTQHGDSFLASPQLVVYADSSGRTVSDPAIELVYEYVRRAEFPRRPSRYDSLFAVDDLAAAQTFRARFGLPNQPIWEVSARRWFRADMNCLVFLNVTPLVVSYYAHLYWAGDKHPQRPPFWEYLLRPPVTAIRRVA